MSYKRPAVVFFVVILTAVTAAAQQDGATVASMIDVAHVGNAGRNLPGFRNLNQREVIQNAIGSQALNAFNRVNLGVPNIQRESSGFGQILSAGHARILPFGLKFYF